jgi:manganese/zinc/iron transport system permease protein
MGIRSATRLKEDAAIGIVLSVFFAIGLVFLSVIQQMNTGNEAGMQAFIYGKAASMIRQDAMSIAVVAALVTASIILLFKEFRVVCFDAAFAAAQGWPVQLIDLTMMALVVLTVVIGLQAVGLILIVALLIIPAAAARFWTDQLTTMTLLAAGFGAISGWLGAAISALAPRMPTGAIIVVVAGGLFAVSMLLAPRRGVIATAARFAWLRHKVAYQHLLRALAETEEAQAGDAAICERSLLARRSWHPHTLRRLIRRAIRRGHLGERPDGTLTLTDPGRLAARRCLRNHRLWEMYLIRYADIAPSHVDRDADEVEHVLSERIIRELDAALQTGGVIPPSPHAPAAASSGSASLLPKRVEG